MDETERLIAILVSAGWTRGRSHWRNCRYCKREIAGYTASALYSPAYTPYHPGCALQSKQAQRLIKKWEGVMKRPATDLDAMLQHLATLTADAVVRFHAEDYEGLDEGLDGGDLWLSLEHLRHEHAWRCGWKYRPDEADEWAISTDGNTPAEAARALLGLMEGESNGDREALLRT